MTIQVQLPDGSKAEFPDGMDKTQIESVLQQHWSQAQQPAAQPQQPAQQQTSDPFGRDTSLQNPMGQSLSSIPEGQSKLPAEVSLGDTAGYEISNGKTTRIPTFVKKAEMISSGAMKGALTFTANLLSLGEKGLRGGGTPTVVPGAVDYWDKKVKADNAAFGNGYTSAGQVGSEMLTTAPVGGILGQVGKGAAALGELAPTGLKTLAKYGTSILGGAGALASTETQRFDPNNPGQLINKDAAENALKNPMSYLLPAIGTKIATWMDASRALGKAKEVIPSIMARDIKPDSASKTASQMVFDSLPNLTGMGKRVNQMADIGDDIGRFISQTASKDYTPVYAKNYIQTAGQELQNTLKKVDKAGDVLWNKPFKTAPIQDVQGVKDEAISAIDLLKGSGVPLEGSSIKFIQAGLRKDKMTVDDAKKLQSLISKASIDANGVGEGIGAELSNKLRDHKDNILGYIQSSLTPEQMKDFTAARTYSSNVFQMYREAPKLNQAIVDERAARGVIKDLTSEAEVTPKKILNTLSPEARMATAQYKVAKALEDSDTAGKINLNTFLDKTAEYTQTPEILGTAAYKSLQGLNKYLNSINNAGSVGWWRSAAMLGAATGGAATAGVTMGAPAAAAAVASYAAAHFIANHSPLKTVLHAMTKDLSDTTYKHLESIVTKHLTRAGFLISEDGVLQHKDEKTFAPDDNTQEIK